MANNKKQNRKKKKAPVMNLKCPFNGDPSKVDYKDYFKFKKFITTRGRLLSPSKTGVSHKCQRKLALSIKRARYLALIPYAKYV